MGIRVRVWGADLNGTRDADCGGAGGADGFEGDLDIPLVAGHLSRRWISPPLLISDRISKKKKKKKRKKNKSEE